MMWRVTAFSSFFLTEELRKRQLVYSTSISGKQEQEPRWKECVDMTSGRYDPSDCLSFLYIYFAANTTLKDSRLCVCSPQIIAHWTWGNAYIPLLSDSLWCGPEDPIIIIMIIIIDTNRKF